MWAEDKDETASRTYLSELKNIRLHLEECEQRLVGTIRTPSSTRTDGDALQENTFRMAEQEVGISRWLGWWRCALTISQAAFSLGKRSEKSRGHRLCCSSVEFKEGTLCLFLTKRIPVLFPNFLQITAATSEGDPEPWCPSVLCFASSSSCRLEEANSHRIFLWVVAVQYSPERVCIALMHNFAFLGSVQLWVCLKCSAALFKSQGETTFVIMLIFYPSFFPKC